MRLSELVSDAYQQCASAWERAVGLVSADPNLRDELTLPFASLLEEVECQAATAEAAFNEMLSGDYQTAAHWAAGLLEWNTSLERQLHFWPLASSRLGVPASSSRFAEACFLADRIDCFLAVMEDGSQRGMLARGCREDLEGMLVLADWCEENGLPAAAREARHLHGLVRLRP